MGDTSIRKSLAIEPDLCTGCQQCELACSFEHEGRFNPARSRIRVFEFEHGRRSVPFTCTQCSEAWCMVACPVDAIRLDSATGAKVVANNCVGCRVCTIACPFGTINFVPEIGEVTKCDLCGGAPRCAEICPTGAIRFIDAEWTGLFRMRRAAAQSMAGEDSQ